MYQKHSSENHVSQGTVQKARLNKYVSKSTHQKAELVGSACLIQHPAQSHRATQLKM